MDVLGWHLEYLPSGSTLQIEGRITVFELFSMLGLVVAVVSLVIAVSAARQQSQTRRAEFSFRIWEAFMKDELQSAFLDIEWGRFKYPAEGPNGFENDQIERGTDRLLYLLDEMALLIESGVLSKSDKDRWSYQGRRVFRNQSIKAYLSFLDRFYDHNSIKRRPHDAARRLFE